MGSKAPHPKEQGVAGTCTYLHIHPTFELICFVFIGSPTESAVSHHYVYISGVVSWKLG